jgi:uncharacterized protein (DUF1800 family)
MKVRRGDVLFLVNRVTQGFSRAALDEARQRGYEGYLEWQLDWERIDDGELGRVLAGLPTLRMTSRQLYDAYLVTGQASVAMRELKQAAILRSVFSRRQLYERMVEFWTDHFNVAHANGDCRILKTADDRDVIRRHALGRFPELLAASARSAAMLLNLDNHTNRKTAPNENYARELMELHTLGVGNFDELAVREAARCLTGWGFAGRDEARYGNFSFNPLIHDTGTKSVLGHAIPAGGGERDGAEVVAMLARHPATARRIATKLIRWLLTYTPPAALVDRVAGTYLSTDGDIKAMIRVILKPSSVTLAAPGTNPKLRRPFHFLCSLLRACGATVDPTNALIEELLRLGQAPFGWPLPDGYPDSLATWGTSLLPRWTTAARLCDGKVPGVSIDVTALLGSVPRGQLGAAISAVLTGGTLAAGDVAAVQAYVDAFGVVDEAVLREALALAASSPSYQYY